MQEMFLYTDRNEGRNLFHTSCEIAILNHTSTCIRGVMKYLYICMDGVSG